MTTAILVLNAGSSSIKFSAYQSGRRPDRNSLICEGEYAGIREHQGPEHHIRFTAKTAAGAVLADRALATGSSHEDALSCLLTWFSEQFQSVQLVAAGHRIVHGGAHYSAPVLLNPDTMTALRQLIPLAPLHQPHNLAAVDALQKLHPDLPQIACFDTAFHQGQAPWVTDFALPHALTEEGIRRYGFHGLSYEYITAVLPDIMGAEAAQGRIIIAHLGAGASMCAVKNGKSVATTMGFTALDGLPMGRRCGTLDPGVVLYLAQQKGMSIEAISTMLYHDSGLFGISGLSDDMRTLLANEAPQAAEAIALFTYRCAREIGSLTAALGGLDALVFTAGIGEHAPEIRRQICELSTWLGVNIDTAANLAGAPRISGAGSKVTCWVIPTDEDLMIARHVWELTVS